MILNGLKGVLRLTTVMCLFVGLVGIWFCGCEQEETQEQKVAGLIRELGHKKVTIRVNVVKALGSIGEESKVQ